MSIESKVITVTGAAGHIGEQLTARIAVGDLFGPGQKIKLRLLEIAPVMEKLRGLELELRDLASPVVTDIELTDDPKVAFDGAQVAFLVGSRPRGPSMERGDLIKVNAPIFVTQGQAINARAAKDVRILIVGNPANTNALVLATNAPDVPKGQISAMMRLDHNRLVAQLAMQAGMTPDKVYRAIIWGNHSGTQVVDHRYATINGQPATAIVSDDYYRNVLVPTVVNRGAQIIETKGSSSVPSAANAAIDHMRDWLGGTRENDWVSMGVVSKGEYGAPPGVVFSFPCVCENGVYKIVPGLQIADSIGIGIQKTGKELLQERAIVFP